MKRAAFMMSCIGAVQGTLLLAITSVLNKLMPAFARAVSMTSPYGAYVPDDYSVSFVFADVLSVALIAACAFCAVKIYRSER